MNVKKKKGSKNFSADVYSHDMKKYQFQTAASSISDAYYNFVNDSFENGVIIIQCVAIYSGLIRERDSNQSPVKIWRQKNVIIGQLVES